MRTPSYCFAQKSRRGALLIALAAGLAALRAAAADPTSAGIMPDNDEVITLSTFQVSTSADSGYRAGNSVSATRIDTPIKDLPFTISAFTEQFISDIGARELPDIVAYAPGVTSGAKEFTQGNTRFSIRGFDGDTPPQRNGFVGNRYVDSANIQRVEVVKGPASLLYGQITPGGAVNYITKRPTGREFSNVRVEAGTDGYWRTVLDHNQPLGKMFQARVVAAAENGFQWAANNRPGSTLFAPSLVFKPVPALSLTVDYEWAKRRETPPVGMLPNVQIAGLTGASNTLNATNFPNAAAFSRELAFVDVTGVNLGFLGDLPHDRGFNYQANGDYRLSDFDTLNTELDVKLGENWTARANYAYNKWKIKHKVTGLAQWDVLPTAAYRTATTTLFDYLTQYLQDPLGTISDPTKTTSVTMNRRAKLQEDGGKTNTVQAEITGKLKFGGISLQPLIGAMGMWTTGSDVQRQVSGYFPSWNYLDPKTWNLGTDFDVNSLPVSSHSTSRRKDTAVYGLVTAKLFNDRLIAVGGARDNNTLIGTSQKSQKTTPQFGAGYKLRPDLLVYASYSESYFFDSTSLTRPNPNYNPNANLDSKTNPAQITEPAKPTTGKGYEAGIKTDFLQGRVSSTLSVFHLERANRVLRARQNVPGLSTSGKPSSQEITFESQGTVDQSEGVEAEVTWSPLDNWQVYATATLMNIKTISFDAPPMRAASDPLVKDYAAYVAGYDEAVGLIKGAVPEGSAEHLGSLWTRYTFNTGRVKGLWIAGGGTYTSSKAGRTANPYFFLASYTLLDATIGYDWRVGKTAWSLQVSGKNLTNKDYLPANQARGLPRRFILSAIVKF
ncbi:MAG TPA: TonB-dependent receptor [Opitutaceae bacterium]|nr:TonB-dependent receptor [Opitutaceae bacterium]